MEADIGKVSSRGQIAIPSGMRKLMGLSDGSKVLFIHQDDSLILKKVDEQTFSEITRPLKKAMKKKGMIEKQAVDMVHACRSR